MVTEEEVIAAASRVWPNAKRIEVTCRGSTEFKDSDRGLVRAAAFDHDDQLIASTTAESLDALKTNLDDMLPQGGQAP